MNVYVSLPCLTAPHPSLFICGGVRQDLTSMVAGLDGDLGDIDGRLTTVP